jgi:hypothetical protein
MAYIFAIEGTAQEVRRLDHRRYFTRTVPVSSAHASPTQLALVFARRNDRKPARDPDPYLLTHLGAVVGTASHKVTTFDRLLKVDQVFALPNGAIDVGQLLAKIPDEHRGHLGDLRDGLVRALAPGPSEALTAAVRALRPDTAAIITWLESLDGPGQFTNAPADWLWHLERDAVNVALHNIPSRTGSEG